MFTEQLTKTYIFIIAQNPEHTGVMDTCHSWFLDASPYAKMTVGLLIYRLYISPSLCTTDCAID